RVVADDDLPDGHAIEGEVDHGAGGIAAHGDRHGLAGRGRSEVQNDVRPPPPSRGRGWTLVERVRAGGGRGGGSATAVAIPVAIPVAVAVAIAVAVAVAVAVAGTGLGAGMGRGQKGNEHQREDRGDHNAPRSPSVDGHEASCPVAPSRSLSRYNIPRPDDVSSPDRAGIVAMTRRPVPPLHEVSPDSSCPNPTPAPLFVAKEANSSVSRRISGVEKTAKSA
ncbi:MAG: hypothetical protein E6G57_16900, partial [Actinobacteria bacterium]